MPELRNLILLTVDAWREDFTDRFAGIPLLPSLSLVSGHLLRCTRFYANAPWTTPALLSVLTGESPACHRVFYPWSEPRAGGPALGSALREAGYELPNICYLNGIHGYEHLGFDPSEAPKPSRSRGDDSLLKAIRAHRVRSQPFFLWYHYKDLHLPYCPEESSQRRLGMKEDSVCQRLLDSVCATNVVPRDQYPLLAEDRGPVRLLYAAGVLELDEFLRPILEEVSRGDLLERTTVVLTADHGEELLDHGHVGHASTSLQAGLFEEMLHIPLFLIDGRIAGPLSLDVRLQGMDLFPTLLSLIGLKAPASSRFLDFSRHILAPGSASVANRVFYFHSARMGYRTPPELAGQIVEGISDGRLKFISERFESPRNFLYDLEADPEENHPVILPAGFAAQPFLIELEDLRTSLGGEPLFADHTLSFTE